MRRNIFANMRTAVTFVQEKDEHGIVVAVVSFDKYGQVIARTEVPQKQVDAALASITKDWR